MPYAVIAAVAVALGAGALAFSGGGDGEGATEDASAEAVKRVPAVAERVERLRGLRFRRRPVPRVVTPDEAGRESLDEFDRSYPVRRRRADEEVVTLLGLLPPGYDARGLEAQLATEEVAGYYDTRRKRLSLVRGAGGGDPLLTEVTLAHELVHALEDQRFDIEEPDPSTDDAASAYVALVEGTATAMMSDYIRSHASAASALRSALAGATSGAGGSELPPYVEATIEFSYLRGERFVRELRRVARGWKLVDFAFRRRPPQSTEQILHPEKYLALEPPVPVRLRAGGALGRGWRRAAGGGLGEFDTAQLLERGDEGLADDGAAGWGGGRYELWVDQRRPAAGCARPCRRRDALVLAWAWDSEADAAEFTPALRAYVERGLKGRRAGRDGWAFAEGAAAMTASRRATVLALAPTGELAGRLAREALARPRPAG